LTRITERTWRNTPQKNKKHYNSCGEFQDTPSQLDSFDHRLCVNVDGPVLLETLRRPLTDAEFATGTKAPPKKRPT
jgi:hypothetical protein